jgi:hypothetical protein
MRPGQRRVSACGALFLIACGACSSSGASNGAAAPSGSPGATGTATGNGGSLGTSTGSAGATGGAPAGGVAITPALPPEREIESSYKAPVATGHFVWIVNPTSGRVAYVDATALTVRTVDAGNGPTYLAAVPGVDDAVLVLNTLSNDATFLSAVGTTLTSRTFPSLAEGSNSWAVSPDGTKAIAWTDARQLPNAPQAQGFHEVTILDLASAATAAGTTTIAVGYRPVSVTFASDSKHAFAVTQDGVSVIELASSSVVATVPLGADGTTDAADTADVSITPDGRLAVVRRDDSADVGVVDLATGVRTAVTLSGLVTDVDVSMDGARAIAVVRSTGEVAILPLAGAAPAAAAITHLIVTGETIGQVTLTADGQSAVLYSNAVDAERLTVLTLAGTPAFHTVKLHDAVLSALPTPDGKFAVVLHPADATNGAAGTGGAAGASGAAGGAGSAGVDAGAPTGAAGPPPDATAFSLVPLDGTQPARIEMTDAPIQAVAISPASDRVLLTVRDDAKQIYGAYMGLLPTLDVQRTALASPPTAAGVVAGANRGYVAQEYPDGRITFLSLVSGEARTLTGYELGARVVQWSN